MKKNIYLAQIIILLSCSYQEKSPVDYLAKTSEMTFNPFIAVLHVPTEDFVNLEDYIVELLETRQRRSLSLNSCQIRNFTEEIWTP